MLTALAPARRRLVLGLVTVAALVLALAGALLLVRVAAGGTAAAERPVPQDRPGPVLLVPGYGGSVASLDRLAADLRLHGKAVTVVRLPDNGRGDLRVQAQALEVAARAARARTGAVSVDVVGYSAGGVVARYWLQDLGGRGLARRLVTLGSPHHGTEVAELGTLVEGACPVACQQLRPASPLLAQLDSGARASRPPSGRPPAADVGPRVVSIWTTLDDVVVPPDSARLDGALNLTVQGVCPSSQVRHSGLPGDPLVQAMVVAQLGPGPVQRLGPQDCRRLGS